MYAILFDETKCVGCGKCVTACNTYNKLPEDVPSMEAEGDGLSGWRRTAIVQVPGYNHYVKKQCLHCLHPTCESACLVGAMKKREDGAVVYDEKKCIGCRYCMLACPVGTPRYQWDKTLPYVQKCDMCKDRISQGKPTACAEACPHEALLFGDRDKLLVSARETITKEPDRYLDHIWGEHELGGTSVFYISAQDLTAILRFPENIGDSSIPSLTWPVMSKTPVLGLSVLTGLVGIYWIIERRMKIAHELAVAGGDGKEGGK